MTQPLVAPNAVTLAYNPASQIRSRTTSNDGYAWGGEVNVDRAYTVNRLNQYTASGSVTPAYDGRGNLSAAGTASYGYDAFDQLTTANVNGVPASLTYDVNGLIASTGTTRWEWDGNRLVTEAQGATILRRYVHGAGTDEPVLWYEGSGTGAANRRWLDADERGSIVRVTDDTGATMAVDSYDEYGIPAASNLGRFQYTGQLWMPELGLYYYKARMYSPTLGRFLQTDPSGYDDGMNWYNYVGSDPVNDTDPTGLCASMGPRPGPPQNPTCARALSTAGKTQAAVQRASNNMATLTQAATANGIDPSLLAAIGVRESGFQNIPEAGGGHGMGVFQLTNRPGVTSAQAYNIRFAANYAARILASNMKALSRAFPSLTSTQLTQATAASYNFGIFNISGNPNMIDIGTANNNYGSNVVDLMSCFSH